MASSEVSSAGTPVPWELALADPSDAKFKDQVELAVQAYQEHVLEKHGGPMQYLIAHLQSSDAQPRESFLAWLWATFPLEGDKHYQLEHPFPAVTMEKRGETLPCKAHIAMLGFNEECSLKPPPSAHASLQLVHHVLNEGFQTSGKPLLVKHVDQGSLVMTSPWASEAMGMPVAPFSLGYVKGMLRASTALALLHMFWHHGQADALLQTFRALKESCSTVYVFHIQLPSVESEVFQNFLLSIRDSISKPPNFITWLHTLRQLKQKGYEDSAAVISRFNALVPKSAWLVGAKANALGNVMALFPSSLIQDLETHVSKWGWEGSALSDDCLSTKKVLPTHRHKAPHKSWKQLCSMSETATALTFKRIIRDHEKPGACRKKVDKQKVDSLAETAALLVNLSTQMMEQFPVKMQDVETHIFEAWLDGSHGWDLELHEVQTEKREKLAVTDVKMFRDVIDMLKCQRPVAPGASAEILLIRLDEDKWTLILKQLEYDFQAFRVYLSKMQSFEVAVHHAKLEWNKRRREEAAQWSTQWMSQKCHIFAYDPQSTGQLNRLLAEHCLALLKNNSLEKTAVATLSYLNWSAPASRSQSSQDAEATCFCQLVAEQPQNLVLLLSPVFHYKVHQRHALEHFLLKTLSGRGVDVDSQAVLMYKERKDARDTRPLLYPLRIVRPYVDMGPTEFTQDETETGPGKRKARVHPVVHFWQGARLLSTGRTEEAEQVPNTQLKFVEDLSDTALPLTTDDYASVRGGKRFEQIGVSAALKLLESLVDKDLPNGTHAVVLVDLALGVGDMFWAWLERCKALRFPLFFLGATSDPMTLEWFQHHCLEELSEKLLSEDLKLPGFTPKSTEPPADVLLSAPPVPQLNLCTVRPGPTIAIPEKVIAEWSTNPNHGIEFQNLLKEMVEEIGEPKPANQTKATGDGQQEPSPKKRRLTEPLETVPVEKMPDTKLVEAAVNGLKKDLAGKITLRIDGSQGWWLVNVSQTSCTIAAGTVVAGFGTGNFHHQPRKGQEVAEVDNEKLLLCDMSVAESILMNGKLENLSEVLHAKELQKGKAEICYHAVTQKAGDMKAFDIVRQVEVYFKPNPKVQGQVEDGGEIKLNKGTGSFAALAPFSSFQAFKHAAVIWSMRWSPKGLMPIKPQICLRGDLVLDGQTAVKL